MIYGVYDVKQNVSIQNIHSDIITALGAGLRWLQIRDKACDKALWPLWQDIAEEAKTAQCQLIINDQVALVEELNAQPLAALPGLHLGQSDTSIDEARKRTPAGTIIGISCHNSLQLAQEATIAGADYVAFGRFFPSKTKPLAGEASLETLNSYVQWSQNWARRHGRTTPLVAVIGGIDRTNIDTISRSPANLIALSNGIWGDRSKISENIRELNKSLVLHPEITHP